MGKGAIENSNGMMRNHLSFLASFRTLGILLTDENCGIGVIER